LASFTHVYYIRVRYALARQHRQNIYSLRRIIRLLQRADATLPATHSTNYFWTSYCWEWSTRVLLVTYHSKLSPKHRVILEPSARVAYVSGREVGT